jgi:7-keto-8-aminopelargonate synthetase-like enzyme
MGSEDAVIFMTGMLANLGCIPAMINSPYRSFMRGEGSSKSAIFADDRCHESLRMACDLCKAHGVEIRKYHHGSYSNLDELITRFGRDNNLVITDGVFSMDGDIAPLKEITDVAEYHNSKDHRTVVYVDDAHGIGILGANGRGVTELLGVEDKVVVMGVLSKAFGTLGGFVIGDKWFTDYLSYCSTHMFSLALPPAETAATIEAIKIVAEEPYRAQKILKDADFLRSSLRLRGYEVLGDKTQIVFIVIGDEHESARVSATLEDEGILCPEIKFPAVGLGRAGLRITTTYEHTQDDLDRFLEKFYKVSR